MSRNGELGKLVLAAVHLSNAALEELVVAANWLGEGDNAPAKVETLYQRRKKGLPPFDIDIGRSAGCTLLELDCVETEAIERFNPANIRAFQTVDGVVISNVGVAFERYFPGGKKEDFPKRVLHTYSPNGFVSVATAVQELGDRHVELGQMWGLLRKQGTGQSGELLTDGHENVFLIPSSHTKRRVVVYVFWVNDGWGFEVDRTDSPVTIGTQNRVFSS